MRACMLSHFSRVRLCATLWTVACWAPLSMGFPRLRILEGVAILSSTFRVVVAIITVTIIKIISNSKHYIAYLIYFIVLNTLT